MPVTRRRAVPFSCGFPIVVLVFFALALATAFGPNSQAQDWEQGSGFRFRHLRVPAGGAPGFSLLPAQQTGITFTNILPESEALTNTIACNGSGVAAGDVDE